MKDIQYFINEIKYNDSTTKRFHDRINENETTELHKKRLSYSLFKTSFEQLCMNFEIGADKDELGKRFKTCTESLDFYLSTNELESIDIDGISLFIMGTSIFSIGLLLNAKIETLKVLKEKLFGSISDSMVEHLFSLINLPNSRERNVFKNAETYTKKLFPLLLIEDESKFINQASNYLEKSYYKTLRSVYWYQTHKGDDLGYFGYLNFELAAYIKIKGFDQTALKQSIYYPYKNYSIKEST